MTFSGNANLGVDCLQVMQTVVSINQSAVKALSSSLKYSIFLFQQFSQMVDSSSNISPYGLITQVSLELSWQLLRYNIFLTTFPLQRIDQVGPKATATSWCLVKSVMASHSRVLSWEHLVLLICLKGNSDCYLKNGLGGQRWKEGGQAECYNATMIM